MQCGAPVSAPGTAARVPMEASQLRELLQETVGTRYKIEKLLGWGGMGAVFSATDTALHRHVAIKVLLPKLSSDENFVRRFEREARTAAQLDHPNIVPIYAVEHSNNVHYFVMKQIIGKPLDDLLERDQPLPIETCQQIIWEISSALAHAHKRGVVHRDVKPANIIIDENGRALVTDFGISKAIDSATQMTATGQVIGTPHYMSPEQTKGTPVDGRSDQYSTAVMAYQMLAGRLPFESNSPHTILYKQVFEAPPPIESIRPELPANLREAIHGALAKNPDDRFSTMEEFASAIWPAHSTRLDTPTLVTNTGLGNAPPLRRRNVVMFGTTIGVLVAGAAVALVSLQRRSETSSASSPQAKFVDETINAADRAPDSVAVIAPVATDTLIARTEQDSASTSPTDTSRPVEPTQRGDTGTDQPDDPTPDVGFLRIDARPFALVSIDGVEIGETPILNHKLPPGTHVIRVSRVGFVTEIDTVVVPLRGNVRRTYRLRAQQ